MKKILLAAGLVASTFTAAHADVSVSGDARMGLTSTDGGDKFYFGSRVRVRFALSGETDGGLKFGASVRAHEAADANKGILGTVFIESPTLGRLTMGDTDSAALVTMGQFTAIGFDESDKRQELKFLTGGSSSKGIDLLYTYTKDNLMVAVSIGDVGADSGAGATQNGDDRAIGVSYTTEFWKLAAGYEDNGVNSQTVLSGSWGNGQFEIKGAYGLRDDDKDQFAIYGTLVKGHTTFTLFHRKDFADLDYNGVGVKHDLGGGMALQAGYVTKSKADAVVNFGATMSF
jgi:outer membrane protein OmpU